MMTVKSDLSPVRGDDNDAALMLTSSGWGRTYTTFFFTFPVML